MENSQKCPECQSKKVKKDGNELICQSCGLVIDEYIYDGVE